MGGGRHAEGLRPGQGPERLRRTPQRRSSPLRVSPTLTDDTFKRSNTNFTKIPFPRIRSSYSSKPIDRNPIIKNYDSRGISLSGGELYT